MAGYLDLIAGQQQDPILRMRQSLDAFDAQQKRAEQERVARLLGMGDVTPDTLVAGVQSAYAPIKAQAMARALARQGGLGQPEPRLTTYGNEGPRPLAETTASYAERFPEVTQGGKNYGAFTATVQNGKLKNYPNSGRVVGDELAPRSVNALAATDATQKASDNRNTRMMKRTADRTAFQDRRRDEMGKNYLMQAILSDPNVLNSYVQGQAEVDKAKQGALAENEANQLRAAIALSQTGDPLAQDFLRKTLGGQAGATPGAGPTRVPTPEDIASREASAASLADTQAVLSRAAQLPPNATPEQIMALGLTPDRLMEAIKTYESRNLIFNDSPEKARAYNEGLNMLREMYRRVTGADAPGITQVNPQSYLSQILGGVGAGSPADLGILGM